MRNFTLLPTFNRAPDLQMFCIYFPSYKINHNPKILIKSYNGQSDGVRCKKKKNENKNGGNKNNVSEKYVSRSYTEGINL